MKLRFTFSMFVLCAFLLMSATDAEARRVKTSGKNKSSSEDSDGDKKSGKSKLKSYKSFTKDKVAIEGLFTFFQDTTDNSVKMSIKEDQLGVIYLCGQTRSQAEGAFFDNGSMGRTFPFYFKREGKKLLMYEKNLRFRADSSSTLRTAVLNGISDHLFGTTKILSKPQDSTNAIIIDPSDFFVRDIENVGYFLGTKAKIGLRFNKKNSGFGTIKSFPENSEIDVRLHFSSSRPIGSISMQNPYNMFHTYHYSLSAIPESDYTPRLADDRVGHFLTLYQDYSVLKRETPYVRYVERWGLKKKNPDARISEPIKPIVYWVDKTVPKEYRDAVAEGIEFWNPSFEKIGFRNAVIAKQMPDTATWDPADIRYSVVRWIVQPGATYAVGPSRANPFTGEIYDADIRISVDFIRYMFIGAENYITPVSFDGIFETKEDPLAEMNRLNPRFCNFGQESAKDAAFGMAFVMSNSGDFEGESELTKKYVHAYIVELVAHEVGHTLGFRHNFKSSSIYTLEQINDTNFTREHSTIGTVMDYAPANIAGKGKVQGEYFASVPGPYDDWVVAYAYSDYGDMSEEEQVAKLDELASRSSEPGLTYGTDEDGFGRSPKSVDPLCNIFDLGDDPIAFGQHRINLSKELWNNAIKGFEKPGVRFQKIRNVFMNGWRSYFEAANFASKYIGGLHRNRNRVSEDKSATPFVVVTAAEQKRAMKFLKDNIFAADAFSFSSDLLNKIVQENLEDFNFTAYSISQLDFPIHSYVLAVQNNALNMLYSPFILGRLVNNELRYPEGAEHYTLNDMFKDTRRAIWGEIVAPANVNSFRRQLQMSHLNKVVSIYLGSSASYPIDARSMAANDLEILSRTIKNNVGATNLNETTKVHFKEVLRQITAAKGAERSFIGARF